MQHLLIRMFIFMSTVCEIGPQEVWILIPREQSCIGLQKKLVYQNLKNHFISFKCELTMCLAKLLGGGHFINIPNEM